jgi:hypothetical protein
LYEPGEGGAVAVQLYDPSDCVVTVIAFVLHPNTTTIVRPPTPAPFAVNVPETVNIVPPCIELGVENAVSEIETGLVSDPVFRFSVIVPGPLNVTRTTPTGQCVTSDTYELFAKAIHHIVARENSRSSIVTANANHEPRRELNGARKKSRSPAVI